MPPRLTVHQRAIISECDKQAEALQGIMLAELQRLWRDMYPRHRRLDDQRGPDRLKKSSYLDINLWWQFQNRVIVAIESGALSLLDLNYFFLRESIGRPVTFDTKQVAVDYQDMLAIRTTQTTQRLQREVAKEVVHWYNTPGLSLGDNESYQTLRKCRETEILFMKEE